MSEKNKDEEREILTEKKTSIKIQQDKLIATRLLTKTKEENPFSLNKDKKDKKNTQEQKQEPKIDNKINTDKGHSK